MTLLKVALTAAYVCASLYVLLFVLIFVAAAIHPVAALALAFFFYLTFMLWLLS